MSNGKTNHCHVVNKMVIMQCWTTSSPRLWKHHRLVTASSTQIEVVLLLIGQLYRKSSSSSDNPMCNHNLHHSDTSPVPACSMECPISRNIASTWVEDAVTRWLCFHWRGDDIVQQWVMTILSRTWQWLVLPFDMNHFLSFKNYFIFGIILTVQWITLRVPELLKTPGVLIIPGGCLVNHPMSQLLQGGGLLNHPEVIPTHPPCLLNKGGI